MAMDGGREDDAPARPMRGPDDAVEQDAVQRRCRGKGIAGASFKTFKKCKPTRSMKEILIPVAS